VLLALAAAGCSGQHSANRASLRVLNDLSAKQNNFGVILDAKTGKALAAIRVNNPIRAAIPDGDGGWYIGGGFIHVNGVLRKRLAHIDRNGRLDPRWKPEANGNGVSVTSLARVGSRLFVAGDFATLDGKPRFQLGAFDLPSGRLRSWRAARAAWYSYDTLLAAGTRLIAGGNSCCSEAGSTVTALGVRTGKVDTSWKPHVGRARLYGGGVYMLASNEHAILIRGLLGRPHGPVAAGEIDPATGRLVRKWSPITDRSNCLWCRLMAAGTGKNRIFASVNGLTKLVAFNGESGALERWHAPISAVTGFYGATSASAVAVTDGRVYATGDFDRVNGVPRNGFAALDQTTARALPSWQPQASTVYGSLLAASGSRLLLAISLARTLRFDFTGLKTFVPVRRLKLLLAMSGPGTVKVGLGRHCNYQQWTEAARCDGRIFRWVDSVQFSKAERLGYHRDLGLPPGRYFIRFVPRPRHGAPQAPYDFPITVPRPKVRSTFGGSK
jgi:hypothetical protein